MPTHPNVLFIISDQHRWDFVSCEDGGATRTPNLDRLADRGTHFRRTFCTAPLCSPSREALAAGRYGVNTGCFTNLHELPWDTPTFVSRFRENGYRTCAIGKTHMEIHAYDSDLCSEQHKAFMDSLGWDEVQEISGNGMLRSGIRGAYSRFLEERGRLRDVVRFYENWHYFMEHDRGGDPNFKPHAWPFAEELHETAFIGSRARTWLRQHANQSEPFFLHVGFAAPHSPIEPLTRHSAFYEDRPEPRPRGASEKTPDWLPEGRRGYRAMITEVDEWIGHLVDTLEELGVADNTLVVYTADHGEMAGDLGRGGKTCFFDPAMRVPLIVAGPGLPRTVRSEALVELIDLGKTLCELCGFDSHRQDQGQSLLPLLHGRCDNHRSTVYAEMGCDRMLFDGRYKLMWGDPAADTRNLGRLHLDKPVNIPASPARLFDLDTDPEELVDLAARPGAAHLVDKMKSRLLARINENTQTQPFRNRGEYRPLRSWEMTGGRTVNHPR